VQTILGCQNIPIEVAKVENMGRIWNFREILIMDGIITAFGLVETILKVINSPIGSTIVENMLRIWNQVEVSTRAML